MTTRIPNVTDDNSDSHPRDDWWHWVLATPIVILVALFIPVKALIWIGSLLMLGYPFALWKDLTYLEATDSNWQPNKKLLLVAGILVTLTAGFLSFLVSPYYLYKRRTSA